MRRILSASALSLALLVPAGAHAAPGDTAKPSGQPTGQAAHSKLVTKGKRALAINPQAELFRYKAGNVVRTAYLYRGPNHRHWGYRVWSNPLRCWLHYDARLRCFFY